MSNKKYEIDEINKYKNYTFKMYNKIDVLYEDYQKMGKSYFFKRLKYDKEYTIHDLIKFCKKNDLEFIYNDLNFTSADELYDEICYYLEENPIYSDAKIKYLEKVLLYCLEDIQAYTLKKDIIAINDCIIVQMFEDLIDTTLIIKNRINIMLDDIYNIVNISKTILKDMENQCRTNFNIDSMYEIDEFRIMEIV
jgi:hypothetical protein